MSLVCMWFPYKCMQLHGIMPCTQFRSSISPYKAICSHSVASDIVVYATPENILLFCCLWHCYLQQYTLWICHVTSGVASHHTEYICLASVMHRSHEYSKTVEFSWSFNLQSSTTGWSYLLPKLSNIHSVSFEYHAPGCLIKHPLEEVQNLC